MSGTLGSYGLGANLGDAPELGLYMVFAGLWFGLVIGYGVWRWADRSWGTAAIAVAATWHRLGSGGPSVGDRSSTSAGLVGTGGARRVGRS